MIGFRWKVVVVPFLMLFDGVSSFSTGHPRTTSPVSLSELLSSCIHANHLGCETIRDYINNQQSLQASLKIEGDKRSVMTLADLASQRIILGSLKRTWGNQLPRLIAEEDEWDGEEEEIYPKLDLNFLSGLKLQDQLYASEELIIYVDPLDASREFVEGRLENVAVLVGIVHASTGQTIAGTVGRPFPKDDNQARVYYGLNPKEERGKDLSSTYGVWPPSNTENDAPFKQPDKRRQVQILTGDSTHPILQLATERALDLAQNQSATTADRNGDDNGSNPLFAQQQIVGGTASKLLRLATKGNTLAILNFQSSLWDTAAPQALVQARGGKVTDLFGNPLDHSSSQIKNQLGVIASSGEISTRQIHDELCAVMRRDCKVAGDADNRTKIVLK